MNGQNYVYRVPVSLVDRSLPITEQLNLLFYVSFTRWRFETTHDIKLESTPPVISNTEVISEQVVNGWTTVNKIHIQGTEDKCALVYISMYDSDDNGNPIFENQVAEVVNGQYDFEITPKLESNNSRTFKIVVTDFMGNGNSQEMNIEKVDNMAPTLISSQDYLEPWRRNEKVTFRVKDNGVGQVQIAFNDPADYQLATYNSEEDCYERTYNFYGDVPTPVIGALYVKDGLGNEKTYKINFNKLRSPFDVEEIPRTTVDVTGVITDHGTESVHNCNDYSVQKYDSQYHWNECSICSEKYISAGRPDDTSWENEYLEIKTIANGTRVLAIKNSAKTHNYTNVYNTMGSSCSSSNKTVHECSCGYSYASETGIPHSSTTRNIWNTGYHVLNVCSVCTEATATTIRGAHYDADNNLLNGCAGGRAGVCKICNFFIPNSHQIEIHSSEGTINVERCVGCNLELFDKTRSSVDITVNNQIITAHYRIYCCDNLNNLNATFTDSGGIGITITQTNYSYANHILDITIVAEFSEHIENPVNIKFCNVNARDINGKNFTGIVTEKLKAEYNAPIINSVDQTIIASNNGWATNSGIAVSGTEDYCKSVTINMIDLSDNSTVYTGTTKVNADKSYSLTFNPDIGADSNGKTYKITVNDNLGNSSSQNITISKYDRKSPEIDKNGQMNTNIDGSFWSTPIAWSKTKNFDISISDEGTGIAELKIQNVTSTKTGETFEDDYGTTTINEDVTPHVYTRAYNFVGDVDGYVTLLATGQDTAGNQVSEYFRVYNLDNTLPEISGDAILDKATKKITATLKDTLSGIRYFGLVYLPDTPFEESDYPTEYGETNTINISESNKWFEVPLLEGNELEGVAASGPKEVEVTMSITNAGTYYIVVEDYAGNRNNIRMEVDRLDYTPPTGSIEIKNKVTLVGGKKAIGNKNVILNITATDEESDVSHIAIINENELGDDLDLNEKWEEYTGDGEKNWTLSNDDGEKTVYLIVKDAAGNISVLLDN